MAIASSTAYKLDILTFAESCDYSIHMKMIQLSLILKIKNIRYINKQID